MLRFGCGAFALICGLGGHGCEVQGEASIRDLGSTETPSFEIRVMAKDS